MGVWLVDADLLATSRFAISPLIETIDAVGLLASGAPQPWERAWLDRHRPAFLARLADDPFNTALNRAATASAWLPDFIGAPPRPADTTFAAELARLRATPAGAARADLAVMLGGRPLPRALDVPDPAGAVADLLQWTWDHTVRRDWPRRRRVYEADIVSRTATIGQRGWAAAISGLGPRVRWLGDGRLQINTSDRPPRDLRGAELLFIPSCVRHGRVDWDLPHRYAVIYPASGHLADPRGQAAPAAVRRLLGPARAGILNRISHPTSTSQLAAITGLALSTVSAHLHVLLEAGLAERRRCGATVLYYQTALGRQLLGRSAPAPPGGRPAPGGGAPAPQLADRGERP